MVKDYATKEQIKTLNEISKLREKRNSYSKTEYMYHIFSCGSIGVVVPSFYFGHPVVGSIAIGCAVACGVASYLLSNTSKKYDNKVSELEKKLE